MPDPAVAGPLAIVLGFLAGSIPFALLVGRVALGRDPRRYGDGNPGAANVARAGGRLVGLVAAVLDIAKGVLPVGLAVQEWGLSGLALALAIVAPVAGHVWNPWLRGRGGKGTATTYGVLIPLTLPLGPAIMPVILVGLYRLVAPDGWAPVLATGLVALGLLALGARGEVVAATAVLVAILALRYASDLRQGLRLRRSTSAS